SVGIDRPCPWVVRILPGGNRWFAPSEARCGDRRPHNVWRYAAWTRRSAATEGHVSFNVRVGQPPHDRTTKIAARYRPVRKHLAARLPPIEDLASDSSR